jgi:hypothetical protein
VVLAGVLTDAAMLVVDSSAASATSVVFDAAVSVDVATSSSRQAATLVKMTRMSGTTTRRFILAS